MSETKTINWMLSKIQPIAATLRIAERIYPDKAPKGAGNPCLIYQVIGGEEAAVTDSGAVESGTVDIQLRYYAGQRPIATAGREALRAVLQNVEVAEFDGLTIEGSSFTNGGDTFEEKTEDYGALSLVAIHWRATAASE